MTGWAALLRAVNLGPHNAVPMADLKALAQRLRLAQAQTFIASGNLLFASSRDEADLRQTLEAGIAAEWGKPISVLLRSAAELADVVARNPWPDRPGNRIMVLFTDGEPALDGVRHQAGERLALGKREIFIDYANGVGASKLVVPASRTGTARNMNTVTKLAQLTAAF